jgi:hypothetical protein
VTKITQILRSTKEPFEVDKNVYSYYRILPLFLPIPLHFFAHCFLK